MNIGDIQNDVLCGHDSELFLASGGHHVLDYVRGNRTVSENALRNFSRNIHDRSAYAVPRCLSYIHLISPDKQSVFPDRLPIPDPMQVGPLFVAAASAASAAILYPIDQLRVTTSPTYLKTDTHFSDFGAIRVAIHAAEVLTGLQLGEARRFLETTLVMRRSHVGDLGCKLVPEVMSDEVFARIAWPHRYFHNRIDGGSNGAVDILISPNAQIKKRLLWMGDSFGRQMSKFLSFVFQEILFLRTPFFHPDIFDQFQPDYLVTENAERYLPSCVSDDERPCFHLFPQLKGRKTDYDQDFSRAFSAVLSFPRPPYHAFIDPLMPDKPRGSAMFSAITDGAETGIPAAASTISIPKPCLAAALNHLIRPEIHPEDFIYKFAARRWRNDPASSITHYYNQGRYSANLLNDLLKEVARVKTFLGETWKPESILDFASGFGCCSRHFANVFPGAQIATCDIHPEAVAFNTDVLELKSYLSDSVPENIDVPKHGVVVAMSFFSHMPKATYARWLRALFNVVQPGGVFVFTANGHVTEKKASTKVSADSSGFGFEPRSEQQDLDGEQYGITISHPRWVLAELHAIPELRVARFQEGLWWAIQDTYVCIRDQATQPVETTIPQ